MARWKLRAILLPRRILWTWPTPVETDGKCMHCLVAAWTSLGVLFITMYEYRYCRVQALISMNLPVSCYLSGDVPMEDDAFKSNHECRSRSPITIVVQHDMTSQIPSYITVPSSGLPILPPPDLEAPERPRPQRVHRSSFPPASGTHQAQSNSKKFTVPTPSLSTNVSDLLLSSLLPANLPKLAASASVNKSGDGRVRELSTQREALSLPLVSNNFRRFVTKVRFHEQLEIVCECS